MADKLDMRRLSAALMAKRGKRGLRAVAVEIGDVSAATLSRVEQGNVPDLDTFLKLCRWLGQSPNAFLLNEAPVGSSLELDTPAVIAAHLRADRTLSPKTADALSTVIRLAYEAAVRGELGAVDED